MINLEPQQGNPRRLAFRFPAEGFPFRPLQVRICRRALELRAPPGSPGTLHHLLEQKLTQQTSIPGLLFSSPEAPRSLQESPGRIISVKSSEDLAPVLLFEPSQPSVGAPCVWVEPNPTRRLCGFSYWLKRGNGRLFAPFIFLSLMETGDEGGLAE